MPTVTELYEEYQHKHISVRVVVNGLTLVDGPVGLGYRIRWSFAVGSAPSAEIEIPLPVPDYVSRFSNKRRPPCQIWVGWSTTPFGPGQRVQVFNGEIVDIDTTASDVTATLIATGMGGRLERNFKQIVRTISNEDVNDVIAALLDDAGITNYVVNLTTWLIGNNQDVDITYQRYGEAVSMLSQFNGSPWFELPSGQIHVQRRDPVPGRFISRQYFAGALSQLTTTQRENMIAGSLTPADIQPQGIDPPIANANAWPRVRKVTIKDSPRDVKNRVVVLGGLVESLAFDGTIETTQVESAADAPSPWVPTPPEFNEVQMSLPVLLSESRAAQMAARYEKLYNRLDVAISAEVDGDPQVYLTSTVQIEDPDYSGVTGKWFVWGYSCSIDENDFSTSLDLRGGGPAAGTEPKTDPWADFTWYTQLAGGGKKLQVVPSTTMDDAGDPGDDDLMVILVLNGSPSGDWDGTIVSYDWSTDTGKSASGQIVTFFFTPGTTVEVTLTVTDNDGRTDTAVKNINIDSDLAGDDTEGTDETTPGQGGQGGRAQVAVFYSAASNTAMGTSDGGQTFFDQASTGLQAVAAIVDTEGNPTALFGSSGGTVYRSTDYCETVFDTVLSLGVSGGVRVLKADDRFSGVFWLGTGFGRVYRSSDNGTSWQLIKFFGLPTFDIEQILTPPDGSVWVIGGDTSNPDRMIWRDADRSGNFQPLVIGGALRAAIDAAGGGHDLLWGVINAGGQFGIGFNGGVSPPFWYTDGDPFAGGEFVEGGSGGGDPLPTGVDAMEGGEAGVWLLADGSNTYLSIDGGLTFTLQAAALPAAIDHMIWERAGGAYLGSASSGILKTVDYGANWGYVRPNAGTGTTWPAGADSNYLAMEFVAPPLTPGPLYAINSTPTYRRLTTGKLWQEKAAATPPPSAGRRLRVVPGGTYLFHADVQNAGSDIYGTGKWSEDEGESWNDVNTPAAPRTHLVDFAAAADGTFWGLFGANSAGGYGLYTSPDGVTWTLQEEHPTAPSARAAQTLAAHPSDPSSIAYIHRDSSGVPASSTGVSIRHTEDGSSWVSHNFSVLAAAAGENVDGIWLAWLPGGSDGTDDRIVCMYQNHGVLGGPAFFFRTLNASDNTLVTFGSLLSVSASAAGTWNGVLRCASSGPIFAWRSRTANSPGPVMWRTHDGETWESIGSPEDQGGTIDADPDTETSSSTTTPSTMVYDIATDRLYTQYTNGQTYYVEGPQSLGRTAFTEAWTEITQLPSGTNGKQTLVVLQ